MSYFEEQADSNPTPEQESDVQAEAQDTHVGTESLGEGASADGDSGASAEGGSAGDERPNLEKQVQGLLNSLKDERKEKQQIRKEYEEFRTHLSQQQAPQQAEPTPEELEQAFYSNGPKFVQQQVESARNQFQQEITNMRLTMSAAMMRDQYDDYDEVVAAFTDAAKANPVLEAQALNHPHPAKFAYDNGKIFMKVSSVGTMDDYEAKVRADERARVIAEFQEKSGQSAAAGITPSNAGARGLSSNGAGQEAPGSLGSGLFET